MDHRRYDRIASKDAVAEMLRRYEICRDMFHGFDWSLWTIGTAAQQLGLLPNSQERILKQEDGKRRYLREVTNLTSALALAVPHEKALAVKDDVGFFQAVRSALANSDVQQKVPRVDLEHVVDSFAAAGLKKPDISILSDEFLAEVHTMPQRNLAVELLQKLMNNEIKFQEERCSRQRRCQLIGLSHEHRNEECLGSWV